jgi:hypothetical protein
LLSSDRKVEPSSRLAELLGSCRALVINKLLSPTRNVRHPLA